MRLSTSPETDPRALWARMSFRTGRGLVGLLQATSRFA